VAYLGGRPRCDGPPPFGPTMKIFYRWLYMKRCVFYRFPERIAKFNNVWWSFFIPIQYAIKLVMWDCIWYDAVIFCVSKFQKKWGEFAASIERSKAKSVSASGGLRPLTSRPGALPLDPAGGSAPRPPFQARALRARHAPPLYQILNTALFISLYRICLGNF